MKTKFASLLAGASLLALAGIANAGEPLQLSDSQMDGVTAGIAAVALANSTTFGDIISNTFSSTATLVNDFATVGTGGIVGGVLPPSIFAYAAGATQGAAVSAIFQAASTSSSNSQVSR